MPGFKFVPFNDFGAVANAVDDKTVAVFLEPVQGEGGIIPAEKEYLLKLRKFCDEKGILLMFDEVQCGMGRTGTFYAWQGYGVEPDALSLAKALGNGYPIGAFIVKRKYSETLTSGTHASTFGGTPLACAVARAVIDTFDNDKILENCRDKGKILKRELELVNSDFDFVKEVRSRGLMVGIALDRPASKFLGQLREEGLIALSAGENVLRLLPPLNITEEQVNTAVDLIRKVFKANKES
jgi:acetylornithine/succinyldiaminopimelate/putrescine aminotransferase